MTSSPGGESGAGDEAASPSPGRAIVIGHGAFADGMIGAVELITGRGEMFVAVSNRGLGGEEIESQLRQAAAETGVKVFFTDLPGGSATLAVRRLMRDHGDYVLVTGTNLAALLDFAFQHGVTPLEAARDAAEKGRLALVASGGAQ